MIALARFGYRGEDLTWIPVGDRVMGGCSQGVMEPLEGDTSLFHGTVRLENGGGFASVKCDVPTLDLSGFSGLMLNACGDGKAYKLGLRMSWDRSAPVYQQAFATEAGVWHQMLLPFSGFEASLRGRKRPDAPPLDPARIASLSLYISGRQAGAFALQLRGIDAVTERMQ
ncbi:MAG: CIA30 family protein [Natronospirillum sp.]|uniref:CIA30 family protein n=1 Tax=Natronospirillum sp. TaxID=2812955 RepID=UPI0025F83760|nr:CIA30 family protein [Natronospirillum sp.]MCH8552911.1 CIA30 family protein [Natronospirillum sp.]